ncbi:hypothetical protein ABPG72_016680 [Tetrahymena utriculariae]
MEDFSQINQVHEILEYSELYKLTKGVIQPTSSNLKIDLSGLRISKENIQNFQLILKNIPKEITYLDVTQQDLIIPKEIRQDDTVLLSLAELPKQINKISYIIDANERSQRYDLLKSSFKEIFEKFGDRFNQLVLIIRQDKTYLQLSQNFAIQKPNFYQSNNIDDEYDEYIQIYEALQYLPKNIRSIEIFNDIEETQQSNQILANSLKGISQSVQRLYLQQENVSLKLITFKTLFQRQNGEVNNLICSLEQFPSAKIIHQKRKYDITEPSDYIFKLLKNEFLLYVRGSDLQENEINSVIPNLKEVFLNKSIKNIILKFKNLSALTINSWQQLLQKFEFLTTHLKSLCVSLKGGNDDFDEQGNDFSQTLFSRIQNLPRKLESLKLILTDIHFFDNSFQVFSNNIQNLPGTLKYLKLKIGNYIQGAINFDQLFQNIKQLPNSLTELHIFIHHVSSAFNLAQNFKSCIGLFTKERKIQKFTIKTQTHFLEIDEEDLKILRIILFNVSDLNDIFNQFDGKTFYLEGVERLLLKINQVQRLPNRNECEQLGKQLKNISKQFQEVKIYIGAQFPFGDTQESLIMYFKLADQNYLRKLFQINNVHQQTVYKQADKYHFYNMQLIASFRDLNINIFNELDKFLGTDNYFYENLCLDFKQMSIYQIQNFTEIHKFVHPKLKEFSLEYEGCFISDSQMPFNPQALGQSLQSSNIEKFLLNVRNNYHIHNKFLKNLFNRIYLWESLKHLILELSSTNIKSKGLKQFSKIIKGRLPNLEIFNFNLTKTGSTYKLLSSSVVDLILAFNCDVCPKLQGFSLGIDEMKNKFLKKDLKDIGNSITKLSQNLKTITLNLQDMIEYQGKGLKSLVKSIAHLYNLEKVYLSFPSYDQNYQDSVFFFAAQIPKYFKQNKLTGLYITLDTKNITEIDQNKLLLKLIKQLKQIDLTRCFCDIYIYNMVIAVGGFEEASFSLEQCTISQETYELFLKFIFDLPPNVRLPQNLSFIPMYDNLQMDNNQTSNTESSDDIDELDDIIDF